MRASNYPTFKEKLEDIIHYGPWVILWCLLFAILLFGFNEVLFFIPDSWKEYGEDGDYLYKTKSFFAFIISIVLASWAFYLYFKYRDENRDLKKAIKIFRCNDKNLLTKLNKYNSRSYDPKRDIPLSLILRAKEQIFYHNNFNNKTTIQDFMKQDFIAQQTICREARNLLKESTEYDISYLYMSKLEKLILGNLSTKIKEKYKKEVYFLRVNFLDLYLDATLSASFLKIEDANEKEKPLANFYKMILNEFYMGSKNYKKQKEDYNEKELEIFFKEEDKDNV